MCRLPTFIQNLLVLLLFSGCLSVSVASSEAMPELEMVYSTDLFKAGVQFLSFSEDGNTFVAGGIFDGVGIFRADDYALLERYYERDDSSTPTAIIISTGHFDANTWYYTATTHIPSSKQSVTHIRTIKPSQEVAQYEFEYGNEDLVAANRNYLAYSAKRHNGTLIDRRTGEEYPIKTVDAFSGFSRFELTRSNRVLSAAGWPSAEKPMLDDPLHQQTQTLDGYVTFSPDEQYAVDLNGFRCKLLKLNGKKVVPLKKQKVVGHCSGLLFKTEKVAKFSPDSKMFAVVADQNVRVYRVEPFQLLLERKMAASVITLVGSSIDLSDTGWLAVVDKRGFLYAWNATTTNLAGQYRLRDTGEEENPHFSVLLAIQPGGNKLLTNYNGLTVFSLPERTSKPN